MMSLGSAVWLYVFSVAFENLHLNIFVFVFSGLSSVWFREQSRYYYHIMWLQVRLKFLFCFSSSSSPGIKSLVSGKQDMVPKSRGRLYAGWLSLWGVSCPGHSRDARLCSLAAENGLTGAAGHQLGYRVTQPCFYISPPVTFWCLVKDWSRHIHWSSVVLGKPNGQWWHG